MSYDQGYQDGRKDAEEMVRRIKAAEPDIAEYERVAAKYLEAIEASDPSQYQIGYGIGFDEVAVENLTPEEIEDGISRYEEEGL